MLYCHFRAPLAAVLALVCLSAPVLSRGSQDRMRTSLPSRGVVLRRGVIAEVAQPTRPEARGMWVVRSSIASPEKIRNVVDTAKRFGYNILFVQVRGRADAYYNSTLEPRAEELSSQPASFDPLATIIQLAHAQGIQVHAWVNTDLVWSSAKKPLSDRKSVV